jgi:hypothetical protein
MVELRGNLLSFLTLAWHCSTVCGSCLVCLGLLLENDVEIHSATFVRLCMWI